MSRMERKRKVGKKTDREDRMIYIQRERERERERETRERESI